MTDVPLLPVSTIDNSDKTPGNLKHRQWGRLGRSVLNGVIGDYLEKQNNPLAIKMGFYNNFKPLTLDENLAHQLDFPLTNKIVVLVHGLTNLETIWDFERPDVASTIAKPALRLDEYVDTYIDSYFDYSGGRSRENYGSKLQTDFGLTPFYLRYNTGLTLEKNARELSALLNKLFSVYPIEIDQLVLVGFSMGGLLTRYAQAMATQSKEVPEWRKKLSECFYIGTPHEGSPLEKFGHLAGEVLRHIPKEYVSHWADWVDIRSEGIQDLKDGLRYLNKATEAEQAVCHSFTEHAGHYFVSGAISKKNNFLNKLVGDSLVRQKSANPRSAPLNCRNAHFEGVVHMHLANSKRVYQQIKIWLEEDSLRASSLADTPIKKYSPIKKPYIERNEHDISTQDLIAGSLDLLASAFDKTLETVETLHYSIADEPFSILQKVPVVSQIADPIEATHKQILDSIYRVLRSGGKWAHSTAKTITRDKV
ncbi:MAG: pimeloyl-ACP methyl ester carboxylesterase [Oleiphilaceae bacterium]|jgi:pimeloyl-ACP methyl ester carboxylesterase